MKDLIHRFEVCGTKMALDVNSGALFVIDDLVWDILGLIEEVGLDNVKADLLPKYDESDLEEGLSEVRHLISNRMMFSSWKGRFLPQADPVIKAMCLFASGACNLNCRYCFLFDEGSQHYGTQLDADVGKKALDFLVSKSGNRRNLEIDFFGGEPLLNLKVIEEIVRYGRLLEKQSDKKFKFTMTTNGLLLDDDAIRFINQECENVVISLDGRPEVHDSMRKLPCGGGSYSKVFENARNLVKARGGAGYYIRGTFSRHNLDFDNDVLHIAESGFKHVSVEPVVEVIENDYTIRKEDLPVIFDSYERLTQKFLSCKFSGDGFNFFHFQVDLNHGPCVTKRVTGCGAGNEYVAVTPEGDIYPCHQFVGDKEFKMGNVIGNTFDASMQLEFGKNNIFAKEDCKQCWARLYCGGGCLANAYHFNRDIKKPYDLGCQMEKKRLECALMLSSLKTSNI